MEKQLTPRRRPVTKMQRKTDFTGWCFVLPAVLLFFCFILLPIVISVVTSFSDFNGINKYEPWGFHNYVEIFTRDITRFRKSILNLGLYVVLFVPLNIFLSMGLALLVSKRTKTNKYIRMAFYIPSLTSGIAVASVWAWMLNPEAGIINIFLSSMGIPKVNWLNDPNIAMVTVVIVALWNGCGANMVLYVAAIQGVNESLIEAAKIEGAGAFKITTKITIPLLRPITFFVMTTVFIGAFQLYDTVVMLFPSGGPQNSALTPIMAINRAINDGFLYGRASAMSVILLLIVSALTFVLQKLNKETY
ncbi:MAG: sugar ABC transporter permease [Clostridiales bacterium]|jgi:multiple sugar transport system permease protein|nr:sugar ABC transporter permease [Clostridiales bacterium]